MFVENLEFELFDFIYVVSRSTLICFINRGASGGPEFSCRKIKLYIFNKFFDKNFRKSVLYNQ